MNENQWDKMFSFIIQVFPSWKPTAETSMVWFSRLSTYESDVVYRAFESVCLRHDSQFPPSLFQVLREIKEQSSPAGKVDEQWAKALNMAKGYKTAGLTAAGSFALRCIGGSSQLGMSKDSELPFIKKDFVRSFNDYKEESLSETKQLEDNNYLELNK